MLVAVSELIKMAFPALIVFISARLAFAALPATYQTTSPRPSVAKLTTFTKTLMLLKTNLDVAYLVNRRQPSL